MELTSLMQARFGAPAELAALGRPRRGLRADPRAPQQQQARIPPTARAAASTTVKEESKRSRRPENTAGEFFVDRTCINCDICRWMAPTVFKQSGAQSAVYHQPDTPEERLAALQALISCPTSSIRTERPPKDIKSAHATFPIPVDSENLEGVYHCGYHHETSFAATAYFIVHPEGNILVDSPRFSEPLAKQLDALGGVRYMFLTHKDDIGDHQRWQARFKCDRVLHELEVRPATEGVEMKLKGEGPWSLASDIDLLHTPGHTEGSVCLHYKEGKGALFSGDHLGGTESDGLDLSISRMYNWYSGHGRRRHFSDVNERNLQIQKLLEQDQYNSN